MSEKLRIALPVVVEGKYDKIKLDSVIDATVLTTGGFGIFNSAEKKALIRRLCKDGVILLCDSDGAGKVIRGYLKGILPPERVYDLYLPKIAGKEKRKRVGSKEGTLGVEGMDADLLRALFAPYATDALPSRAPITKADFYAYGLSGGANAAALRDALEKLKLICIDEMAAQLIAWFVSVLFAFVTSKFRVFENGHSGHAFHEFLGFFGARALSGVIENGGFWIFAERLDYNDYIVKLALAVFVVVSNYALSKFLIFRKK